MTDKKTSKRRPPLYRTVLSVAVAALVAVWLPFTALYVSSIHPQSATPVVTYRSGHAVITTRTSGGRLIQQPVSANGSHTAAQAVPVSTRSS